MNILKYFDSKRNLTPCKFSLKKIEFLFYVKYKNSPYVSEK